MKFVAHFFFCFIFLLNDFWLLTFLNFYWWNTCRICRSFFNNLLHFIFLLSLKKQSIQYRRILRNYNIFFQDNCLGYLLLFLRFIWFIFWLIFFIIRLLYWFFIFTWSFRWFPSTFFWFFFRLLIWWIFFILYIPIFWAWNLIGLIYLFILI